MKNQSTMEGDVTNENGLESTSGIGISCEKQNGDDTEDDDDDDRNEPATSVADLCSASHEFEWLSPTAHGLSYPQHDKQTESNVFTDLTLEHQQNVSADESGIPSCHASPARSSHHRHQKPPTPMWPRRSADMIDHMRLSPSPYNELHGCRRHLSPMRSSWCCPSPPPPHAVCIHHGSAVISNMELVPYNHECCGTDMSYMTYQSCSCLPPTGLSHSPRYQESHTWCHSTSPHHEIRRRESSSPCAMHRSCQGIGGSRRSRSSSSRKRDCSPSALSPRYSPIQNEQNTNTHHTTNEQWQIPLHSEDVNNSHKVQELESDKKNLILQASVLADQVEAQADKITELERLLDKKKEDLIQQEHSLHQEVLARSAVENSKLELMTELSNLRLRLTVAERDRKESDDKCRKLESEIITFKSRLIDLETEYAILKGRVSRNGTHIISSHDNYDYEKLKSTLDSVAVSSEEKDHKLDDLRSSLTKYKKLQDIVLSGHGRKVADISSHEGLTSDSGIYSQCNNDSFNKQTNTNFLNASKYSTLPSTSSIPKQFNHTTQLQNISNLTNSSHNSSAIASFHKSNSMENICPSTTSISSNNQYGTLPRQTNPQALQQIIQTQLQNHDTHESSGPSEKEKYGLPENDSSLKLSNKKKKNTGGSAKSSGVSFGKGFFKLKSGKRSSSEPYLEKENADYIAPLTPQPFLIKAEKDKNKGFFKLFSKWKKSGSQNIDKIEGDFKRGGCRATAGPRLGWSRDLPQEIDIPFCRWNTDMIVDWLNRLGLTMYISECRRWMCNGDMLSKASGCDFEKELSIKNPLHKKKLLLAVKSMISNLPNVPATINSLDYHWVVRWLDDVGLPQYKDAFAEARVDGRVLHCLTVDDLLFLKVTSQLHHVSIRRGIQLLREKGFDPHCLIRRSLPDETNKTYSPELVALWSNHRVMEWLRTVDLSEYAPNLRGSGVHGALIIYEPKFDTNLFATLLNIPPTKTLLRRHLATHFKHIVGDELTQLKREKETETPLSPSVKLKNIRKPQFALKKKRNKSEMENEDYICPMDIPVILDAPKQSSDGEKLVVRRNSDPSPQEQRHIEIQEQTVDRIEAVSKEISSLTTLLQDENLNGAPSTIV